MAKILVYKFVGIVSKYNIAEGLSFKYQVIFKSMIIILYQIMNNLYFYCKEQSISCQ